MRVARSIPGSRITRTRRWRIPFVPDWVAASRGRSDCNLLRYSLLFVGAGIVMLLCAAGAGLAASEARSAKPVLRIGLNTGPVSLDPAKNGDGHELTILSLAYASILHQNADGSISSGLATSWRYIGSGNKDFEFTLRRNARFSDGTLVTARAVKSWLNHFSKAGGPLVSGMGPIRTIETIGKWTVRLHLRSPNPGIPTVLSESLAWGLVASPAAMRDPNLFGTRTAGAGPYVLMPAETVAGDHYTFVPNRFFYDQSKIRWGKVIVKVIQSPSSMLQAVKTGQLDVAFGDVSTATAAESAGFTVRHAVALTDGLVFLDRAGRLSKPLSDVRVRQALNYAIDREAIAKGLFGRYAVPTSQWVTTDGVDPKYENYYSYNPAKAKSLLSAAGYPNGFTAAVVSPGQEGVDGEPLTQAVAKYLSAIGVTLKTTTASTASEYIQLGLSGTFPLLNLPNGGHSMWLQYQAFYKPNSLLNQGPWDDPVLDKAWLKAQRLPSKNALPYWRQMSARTVTQAVLLPVVNAERLYYMSKRVGGGAFTSKRPRPYAFEWFPK